MSAKTIIFLFLALLVLGPAAYVATTRHVVRAGFALIAAFFGVAGLFAWLGADFLAGTQVLVYAGGILVLLLFGVMLTQNASAVDLPGTATRVFPAALISAAIAVLLIIVAVNSNWAVRDPRPPQPTTAEIGQLLLTRFVLPFELASVLLLAVMVGAAVIARRDHGRKS